MQASPMATPEKWMSLSSPIMISSISLQWPSFTEDGSSNVDVMSPPGLAPDAHKRRERLDDDFKSEGCVPFMNMKRRRMVPCIACLPLAFLNQALRTCDQREALDAVKAGVLSGPYAN